MSKPLTMLLKKDQFHWSEEAEGTFNQLKEAMTFPPLLALLDFSKDFVIKIDACNRGIGAVFMQEGHPLAYINKALSLKY